MTKRKRIEDFLYEERMKKNVSQEKFAKEIGIAFVTYNNLESGNYNSLSYKTIAKISEYFGISPEKIREML